MKSLRGLRRDPATSVLAVLVMALGIGSVTAMFSVVNAVLLRPLSFQEPDELYELRTERRGRAGNSGVGSGDFDKLRALSGVTGATLAGTSAVTLTGAEGAENVNAQKLAGDGLALFGVQPALGALSADPRAAIIAHRLWQRRYRGDRGIVGRAITLNGEPWTIAAVMPERFMLPNRPELWMPWQMTAQDLQRRGESSSNLWMRVKSGATPTSVAAAAQAAVANPDLHYRMVALRTRQLGDPGPTLWVLLGAVGLVLLIACLNAGNLLVARGLARREETAVRAALGAGRRQVLGPLIAECVALTAAAAVLGTALAWLLVRALPVLLPERTPLPRLEQVSIDGLALAMAFAAGMVCIFFAGLAPAIAALRIQPATAFGDASRSATASRATLRFGAFSAIVQMALSVMLLMGAGLLLRSLWQTIETDPGYRREGVLTAGIPMPYDIGARFGGDAQVAHYRNVLEAVRALPGVRLAAVTTVLPQGRVQASIDFGAEGARQMDYVQAQAVSPDYFSVMGIPLRAGRAFDDRDTAGAGPVVIVSEATARKFWPGENPVGKRTAHKTPMTVIGVVGDVRNGSLREAAREQVYRALPQFLFALHGTALVVRTAGPPELLAAPLRALLRERFPNHPVADVRTMAGVIDESVSPSRFFAALITGFAGLALLIAAVGLYGLLAQAVATRRREIGIRLAVGASPRQVAAAFLWRGIGLVAAGLILGALGSLAATRLLQAQLYQVQPGDPLTMAAVAAVLAAIALVAMALPAWRAARVDPVRALRVG
ncbi:MAG: ABC transporter permease [Bryobacterales bacterium]|nr:ABC transporter permease [Bryobacterales bacterium]